MHIEKNAIPKLALIVLIFLSLATSCSVTPGYPELNQFSSDSIYRINKSEIKYSNGYASYLRLTTKDPGIHVGKELQYDYYPWKEQIGKLKADSFLAHLEKTLKPQKNYKSAFGELPYIESTYTPIMANNVMAELLMCKVVQCDLRNSSGDSITLDENEVSINKNLGVISFGLAKWDLQGQSIKGNVTLELSLPYEILKVEITAKDKGKTLTFGHTEISILEVENNVLHYSVKNDDKYSVSPALDSCMSSSYQFKFPGYFYDKLRMKPNLTYKEFIADSVYFELGHKLRDDVKIVRTVYFSECDPAKIYLYGFKKSEVLTKRIKIPIDAKVNL